MRRLSRCRLPTSKLWMTDRRAAAVEIGGGQGPEQRSVERQAERRRSSSGAWSPARPRPAGRRRSGSAGPGRAPRPGWGSGTCRRTRCCPGGSAGSRSLARRVRSSARVKSSVNQPVTGTPSMVLVVRRPANSVRVPTSVVPLISFSCRATGTPSLVSTTSGSMTSAHCRIARRTRRACARAGSRWRRGARSPGVSAGSRRWVRARVDDDHLGVVGGARVGGRRCPGSCCRWRSSAGRRAAAPASPPTGSRS